MFQLPDAEAPQAVADWIELELVVGEPQLSKAKVSSIVESATGSEPGEAFLSDVWRQLEERHSRYSRRFFLCDGNLVLRSVRPGYSVRVHGVFAFLAVWRFRRAPYRPQIFERVSAEAIKNYLEGRVFVFGWPVLPDIQTDIALRVKDVAAAAREKFVESPAERYKDRGVDVIAWKPFEEHSSGEHRSNQLVILAQCAAGANWRQKTGQLPFKAWTEYVHWACYLLIAFAVPRVIPEELWHDISREGGILFDRIRIVNLLPNGVPQEELSAEIVAWVHGRSIEDMNRDFRFSTQICSRVWAGSPGRHCAGWNLRFCFGDKRGVTRTLPTELRDLAPWRHSQGRA